MARSMPPVSLHHSILHLIVPTFGIILKIFNVLKTHEHREEHGVDGQILVCYHDITKT